MKGGNTKNIDIKKNIVNNNQTKVSEKGLDILSIDDTLLQRLHIILAITREQIINNKKFFKLQIIKKAIPKTENLNKTLLFNFKNFICFQNILIH